jgi:hypothetical protein
MAGRQVADVIFCLDASGSMGPCFDALRKHVQTFVKGLEAGGQFVWDLRLDFLAYKAGASFRSGVFGFRSLHRQDMDLVRGLYGSVDSQSGRTRFFSTDLNEFSRGLDQVQVGGDEATFIALDTALDFPWRVAMACHRVVIVMTDEALETGVEVRRQLEKIPELIEKLHALRVKLFIVAPPSDAFDAFVLPTEANTRYLKTLMTGYRAQTSRRFWVK